MVRLELAMVMVDLEMEYLRGILQTRVIGVGRMSKSMLLQSDNQTTFNRLYLPLEIFAREYYPKLALSVFASDRNYEVIFGHKWFVNAAALKVGTNRDVYLEKGVYLGGGTRHLSELRKRGVILVGYDEESGLNFSDYGKYALDYLRPEGINFFDYWLTWGPRDFTFLNQFYGISIEKLGNFGTPRSAYWTESSSLVFHSKPNATSNCRSKRYLLICTNFVWQSSVSFDYVSKMFEDVPVSLKEKLIAAYNEPLRTDYEKDSFKRFQSAIQVLLSQFDLDIVVRPHPAEIKGGPSVKLKEYFGERVSLDRSSPIDYLIRDSAAVFHMGSTVAFESVIANKTVISLSNLDGPPNSFQEQNNSDLVSFLPKNSQELIDIVYGSFDSQSKSNSANIDELIWQADFPRFYHTFLDRLVILIAKQAVQSGNFEKLSVSPLRIFAIRLLGKYMTSKNSIDSVKRPNIGIQKVRDDVRNLVDSFGLTGNWQVRQLERSTFGIRKTA